MLKTVNNSGYSSLLPAILSITEVRFLVRACNLFASVLREVVVGEGGSSNSIESGQGLGGRRGKHLQTRQSLALGTRLSPSVLQFTAHSITNVSVSQSRFRGALEFWAGSLGLRIAHGSAGL